MGSYHYVRSAFFGLLFLTSFYPAVTYRSTKGTTLSESSPLSLFDGVPSAAAALSSHTSSSSFFASKSSLPSFPSHSSSSSSKPKDFVSIQTNRYGERDIRVVLGSVRLHVLSVPSDTRHQLELRRTSDRRHYVTSVYKKGFLRDCEFTDNATDIANFVSEFNTPKSSEAPTEVYPIYRHGRIKKKKARKSKPDGWNIRTIQDGYKHRKNNNHNNRDDDQHYVSKGRSNGLDRHGTMSRRGRYRRSAGHILQIRYERSVSDLKFLNPNADAPKALPYAVLFDANDIGSYKPDGEDVYLNLRINPRTETRGCRLLYRRVRRMSRYNRSRQARGQNVTPYKIDNKQKQNSQGLPAKVDIRNLETPQPQQQQPQQQTSMSANSQSPTKHVTPTNDSEEATNNHKTASIHPHRHQHHNRQHNKQQQQQHHTSVTSRTPMLTSPFRTVAPNLTAVAGHQPKDRQRLSNGSSNTGGRRRSRRQLNGMLIYPGTKWCGNGNTAEAFDDLGSEEAADMCCREHDYCPFTIESFTRRFNLFNYRLHTLSHCECDYQFRKCLSKEPEQSTVSHLIGRIYFDFLGSRCFVFTKEKYCVERSWWGKCRRYGIQLTAKIKVQEGY